ncbi:CsbD family protein [Virgibacillus natechei]|uniref:CsbD family protein n=1 Tax=Virgibacillus sp. CBA3643 TaxID=2942278 RepID=UPI0035A2BD31
MSNGHSDKFKGKISKAKGEIKDQVGNAADNRKIQSSGKKDKVKGTIQDATGEEKKRKK